MKKKLTLLKLKSRLDGVTGRRPVSLGSLKSLKNDLTTTTVLVINQLLSVLTLLLSALLEELLETGKGLVDVAGPSGQGEVDLRSLKLLADLFKQGKSKKQKAKCLTWESNERWVADCVLCS